MVTHGTHAGGYGGGLPWPDCTPEEVTCTSDGAKLDADGAPVEVGRVIKMSKTQKNVVDPDAFLDQYGADAARWFMLSDSPPERALPWSEAGHEGAWWFVPRLWRVFRGSEERRVGTECVGQCETRRLPYHSKNNHILYT